MSAQNLTASLEGRIKKIIDILNSQIAQNQELRAMNEDLRRQLSQRENEIEALEKECKILRLSAAMQGNDKESVQWAKRQITQILQEVDKCIALLNNT